MVDTSRTKSCMCVLRRMYALIARIGFHLIKVALKRLTHKAPLQPHWVPLFLSLWFAFQRTHFDCHQWQAALHVHNDMQEGWLGACCGARWWANAWSRRQAANASNISTLCLPIKSANRPLIEIRTVATFEAIVCHCVCEALFILSLWFRRRCKSGDVCHVCGTRKHKSRTAPALINYACQRARGCIVCTANAHGEMHTRQGARVRRRTAFPLTRCFRCFIWYSPLVF
jgi:hypothetical protein